MKIRYLKVKFSSCVCRNFWAFLNLQPMNQKFKIFNQTHPFHVDFGR